MSWPSDWPSIDHRVENGVEFTIEVYCEGSTAWFLNGSLHRESGPAIELENPITMVDYQEFWWNGVNVTQEVQDQGIDQLSPEEIRFWLPILAAQKSEKNG